MKATGRCFLPSRGPRDPRTVVVPSYDVGIQLPATRKVHAHQEQSGPAPVQSRAVGLRPVAAPPLLPPLKCPYALSIWTLAIYMYLMRTIIPELA